MENYDAFEKERYFNLRQFLFFLIKNIVIIISCVLIFVGLLDLYGYKKKKFVGASANTISAIIKQNRDAFYNQSSNYTDAYRPYGTVESRAKVYIDFNYSNIIVDDSSEISNAERLSKDALLMCVSESTMNEIIKELNLTSYDDMKTITSEELSWMINKNMDGMHVLNIVVTDINPKRAHDIAALVSEAFVEKSVKYGLATKAEILDEASNPNSAENNSVVSYNKKAILKYTIVGALIGVLVAVGILALLFVFKDTARTYQDIEYAGFLPFSVLRAKQYESDLKKTISKIECVDSGKIITLSPIDDNVDINLISDTIGEIFDKKSVKYSVFKSTSSLINDENGLDEIIKSNDYVFIITDSIKSNEDALEACKYTDSILFFSKQGKTLIRDIVDLRVFMQSIKVNVLGVTMVY